MVFLSTLSLRRATAIDVFLAVWAVISIHALLAESDLIDTSKDIIKTTNFYPRSPCGERPIKKEITILTIAISIHALLAESDDRYGKPVDVQFVFLSTLSLRRATVMAATITPTYEFLSTLSLRRATRQPGYMDLIH